MWLLTQTAWELMAQWRQNQIELSDERIEAALDKSGRPGSLTVANKSGVIPIEGILTQKRDFGAMFFGGGNTLYPDIISSLAEADADPDVERIVLHVGESPGGEVTGLFKTMDAIRATKKPVDAVVDNMAASGAYGLVAQADTITTANESVSVGSVGVAQTFFVSDRLVDVASTNAPKKRPDVSTDEGKAIVQETLDDYERLFIDAIAQGRGTTPAAVKSDFGQGAIVLAQRALKAGMIDSISPKKQTTAAISGDNKQEVRAMDLREFMAKHPEVYQEAVQIGKDQEFERVAAHLELGKSAGSMDLAIKNVNERVDHSPACSAQYQAVAIKNAQIQTREQENPPPLAPAGNTLQEPEGDDKQKSFEASVLSALNHGLDMEALSNG
jgi:ClpP class serine protease